MKGIGSDYEALQPLPNEFYLRDVVSVAKDLLGKVVIRRVDDSLLCGKIVEVEAYDAGYDEASHSFKGVTNRNKEMFEEGGRLYVYFIYGVHFCANIVTGKKGIGAAVLIRALEPICGEEDMQDSLSKGISGKSREHTKLLNGPGKVCKALQINKLQDGCLLSEDTVRIVSPLKEEEFEIVESTRIGISKSKELPFRFYIKGSKYISCK